jgi:hypothetical protein
MDNFDLNYLNSISDTSQYPAARCGQGDNIYMYHRSASSGAEAMNAAYKEVRARTAVDLLNACLLLIKLESDRFHGHKKNAWQLESLLTPAGVEEIRSVVVDEISETSFRVTVAEQDDQWKCLVQRNGVGYNRYTCMFPKDPINGSHFGCCSCNRDKTSAAPCDHMVAAVQSGKLPPVITQQYLLCLGGGTGISGESNCLLMCIHHVHIPFSRRKRGACPTTLFVTLLIG